MRNLYNETGAPNSYVGIIKEIYNLFMELAPSTDEGKLFVENLFREWSRQVENNWMPLLFVGGIENKEKYLSFSHSDPSITEFGKNISLLIKGGDYNLLVNLCAEEHYKNTGVYPEWLESDLRGTSEQCKQDILQDKFNGVVSDLYDSIKKDLVQSGAISIDETAEMYNKVVSNIKNYILKNSEVDTVEGQRFLNENINKLFESKTPILDLKEFKTNAQQVAPHDAKLMDILKFVNKNVKNSPSLNVLLNIAKEEHLQNTGRTNEPANDEVLEKLKDYWTAGDSEIEQAIKNGIFDQLKSNLIMNLKSDMIPDSKNTRIVHVPEEAPVSKLLEAIQDLAVYTPVGVMWDDNENNQKLAFIGEDIFEISQESETEQITYNYKSPDSVGLIPDNLRRFKEAYSELSFDSVKQIFRPASDKWDFDIHIENGDVFITNPTVEDNTFESIMIEDISEVRELFVETLNLLELSETLTEQDLALLRRDADNFVIVAMNWKKLYAFDDLLQIQSLNENQMVIIPAAIMEGNGTKQILVGTNQKKTEEYKSWQELVNNINRNIGLKTENSVNKIFESKLSNEINQNIEKVNKINQLKNQQQQLNQDIQSKQNLLKIADPNSPAQEKLQSELDKLNSDLDINLQELDMLVNQ